VIAYRKRRWSEAFMLLLAIAVAMGGYLLTHLNIDQQVPELWPWAVGIFAGLALVAHLVVRIRIPYADPLILPIVMLLNGIGLAMIHRLDLGTDPVMHSAELQLMWTAIGVAAFCIVLVILPDYRILHRYTYLLFLAGMVVLMLPLLPVIGVEKHGSRIWIQIATYSFQPAELAKIILAIAFASYLVDRREVLAMAGGRLLGIDLPRPRDLGPILIMWLASLAVLVFQKDLGTSLLFFGLFVVMLYVATERPSWPILGVLLFVVGAVASYPFFSHVQTRVDAWLNPFSNYDQNYQVIQGQFGLAWGGLFGTGWGLGRPNLTPLAKSDFISAAIGEELGVTGLMAIILIYGLLCARGLRAALGCKDPFGKLLAAGLSSVFAIQVFTILGGVTRLLPLTGLTTPFLSQGGSSLVANYAMVALLLVITHHARRPVGKAADPVASLAAETTQVIEVAK
jgi:cell division protein FtsW (lipid II flippase)